MKFTFLPNSPTGRRTVPAFVNGPRFSGLDMVELDEFSREDIEHGRRLRAERERLGLYLGQAARVLGVSIVDLSAAERGKCRLHPEDQALLAWSAWKEANP